jgi:hypothetical protein
LNQFLDYDKSKHQLFENVYLKEQKYVIKIPLKTNHDNTSRIIIEHFDLTKYLYLIAY